MSRIIASLMGEHEAIRGQMKMVGDSARKLESFCLVVKDSPLIYPPKQLQALANGQMSLKQAMDYLGDGLLQHHDHEEGSLRSYIGETLLEAIKIEHRQMLDEVNLLNAALAVRNLPEMLKNACMLKQKVDDLCRFISEHSLKEDAILLFLKKLPANVIE